MGKFIIFAGVNGAGKTTFYTTYKEIRQIPRINIDEIVRSFIVISSILFVPSLVKSL